jgi:hypothetical protein
LQTLPPLQPPRESSAPTSAQAGWLDGVAQVVAPFRQGPMPWMQGTFATQTVVQTAAEQVSGQFSLVVHWPLVHISTAVPDPAHRAVPLLQGAGAVSAG